MELWDAYGRDMKRIPGAALVRGEAIPEGMYHLVSEILVRHTDGHYLLMRRDKRKPFGGMWEASAGGSALQGEDARACAVRELREETGVEAKTLTEVGRVVRPETHTIYAEFLCLTDVPRDGIVLQEGETDAYRWVTAEELAGMGTGELAAERIFGFVGGLRPADISRTAGERQIQSPGLRDHPLRP